MAKQKHQQREAYEPLLVNHGEGEVDTAVHDLSTTKKVVKRILEVVMWLLFAAWVAVIFCSPSESVGKLVESWIIASASGSFYGITGAIFLVFSGPILAIAFLAVACLIIHGEGKSFPQKKSSKDPKFRLRTFPLLVDGPLGVVSAAEFIGICLFVVFFIWAIYAYTMRNLSLLSELHVPPQLKSTLLLELSGLRFGSIGLYCLAFLFLPVARGSVLLRVTDIPFEQATRYHVWLGHMTMLFFTLHGAFYLIAWALEGRLLNEILGWKDVGVANLPGVISLLAGLLMWVTSLSPVRKKQFELFFYTHQLYVVFVVFLALHVGDFIFSIAAGGVFLFIMDRFLRFCQSRRTVDIISATCLPCGTVELTLSKPGSLQYNALSFIFLQIQELSWLQWHPFSVSSSPLNRMNNLSVLIKVLGGWTAKLKGSILDISESKSEKGVASQSFSKITASVEGPYGHEFPYHLTYENLILVAGGVGISPFFAILSDILHLITEGRPCLPKNVLVLWAIKKSDELPLLSALDMESICPTFPDKLNLEVRVYITRESEPQVEEGEVYKGMSSSVFPVSSGCGMSVLVGTGNRTWSGVYVISSMVGFAILMGLLDILYINPRNIYSWWYKGLLFVVCMVASVVIFGGIVICLWHHWSKGIHSLEDPEAKRKEAMRQQSAQAHPYVIRDNAIRKDHASLRSIYYGSRPNFKEIFSSVSECWGNVDVGVIVCGPPTLQSSVAKECRSQNLRRGPLRPFFHFNSHSFDL